MPATYQLTLTLSNGQQINAGTINVPDGPKGDPGDSAPPLYEHNVFITIGASANTYEGIIVFQFLSASQSGIGASNLSSFISNAHNAGISKSDNLTCSGLIKYGNNIFEVRQMVIGASDVSLQLTRVSDTTIQHATSSLQMVIGSNVLIVSDSVRMIIE